MICTMAKLSVADKMRIQTLREQGLGARTIRKAYPEKRWALSTIYKICKRVDSCGSAIARKVGSGRLKTARTAGKLRRLRNCSVRKKINQPRMYMFKMLLL